MSWQTIMSILNIAEELLLLLYFYIGHRARYWSAMGRPAVASSILEVVVDRFSLKFGFLFKNTPPSDTSRVLRFRQKALWSVAVQPHATLFVTRCSIQRTIALLHNQLCSEMRYPIILVYYDTATWKQAH